MTLTYNRQLVCCRTRRGGRFTVQRESIYVADLQPRIFKRRQSVALVEWEIVLRDVSSGENIEGLRVHGSEIHRPGGFRRILIFR